MSVSVSMVHKNSGSLLHDVTIYFLHAQAWLENNRFGDLLPQPPCQLEEIPESVARCHAEAWTCNAVRE